MEHARKKEMERIVKAGQRHFLQLSVKGGDLDIKDHIVNKREIVLFKPKEEKDIEDELKEQEEKVASRAGLVSKKNHFQRKEEEDEFVDDYGIDDEKRLWHQINKNAQFKQAKYESDPKVDMTQFALD